MVWPNCRGLYFWLRVYAVILLIGLFPSCACIVYFWLCFSDCVCVCVLWMWFLMFMRRLLHLVLSGWQCVPYNLSRCGFLTCLSLSSWNILLKMHPFIILNILLRFCFIIRTPNLCWYLTLVTEKSTWCFKVCTFIFYFRLIIVHTIYILHQY